MADNQLPLNITDNFEFKKAKIKLLLSGKASRLIQTLGLLAPLSSVTRVAILILPLGSTTVTIQATQLLSV